MDWKKPLEIGGVLLALAGLGYWGARWALEGAVNMRKQVQVPDLRGK